MTIIIKRGPNDTTDSVIKKFQKKVALENVIQEYRDREYHKTASERRKERREERLRKIHRAARYSNS